MSKLLPLLLVGTGAAVVSVGGVYLLNGSAASQEEIISPELTFTDLATFKSERGVACSKKYFKDTDYGTLGQAIDTDKSVDANDLKGTSKAGTIPKSCLVINWERTDSTDTQEQKWTGVLKWLWSFVNGDRGFVMFSIIKPSATEKHFDLEGGIYFLAQENKTWKIKKHKEVSGTSKTIEADNFDNSFPQVGDGLDGTDPSQPHWGFISGKAELDKLCGKNASGCPKNPVQQKTSSPFKEVWKWIANPKETQKTPNMWSKSFDKNLSGLFGEDGFSNFFTNSFSSFKGTWKKQSSSQGQ